MAGAGINTLGWRGPKATSETRRVSPFPAQHTFNGCLHFARKGNTRILVESPVPEPAHYGHTLVPRRENQGSQSLPLTSKRKSPEMVSGLGIFREGEGLNKRSSLEQRATNQIT